MKGRDKLLETINNIPLIRRVCARCCDSQAAIVRAVLRPDDMARTAAIEGLGVEILRNNDWQSGMATSLKRGLRGLARHIDAVLIVLGDMPDITARDIDALIAAYDPDHGTTICQGTNSLGAGGHPVLFGRRHFAALRGIYGDDGGRAVIAANPAARCAVTLDGAAALTDLDTPADWTAYRAGS